MKNKFKNIKNKILTKTISKLQYILIQLTQSGIRSKESIYIYQPSTEQYISNLDNYDYPLFTNSVDNAINIVNLWTIHRKIILYKLNLGLEKENKFIFKRMLGLYGGNFGFTVNTQVSSGGSINGINETEKTLSDIDNMSMDEM